jgi:hypothetical protein
MAAGEKAFFGLLVAAALGTGGGSLDNAAAGSGIAAARASQPADKNAAVKLEGVGMTEGWLYLGRRSEGRWSPPSRSISGPRYPVKPGHKVVVRRDALFYDSMDCKVTDVADFKADGTSRSVLLVKADKQGLEIVGPAIECQSAGRAKTVWANVRIPTARLVTAER